MKGKNICFLCNACSLGCLEVVGSMQVFFLFFILMSSSSSCYLYWLTTVVPSCAHLNDSNRGHANKCAHVCIYTYVYVWSNRVVFQARIERSKGVVQPREMAISFWWMWYRGSAYLEKRSILGETIQMIELMTSLRSLRLNLKETSIIQL